MLILFTHIMLETIPYKQLGMILDSGLNFFFFQIHQIGCYKKYSLFVSAYAKCKHSFTFWNLTEKLF